MVLKMTGVIALMFRMMIGATSATLTHVVGGNVGWKLVNYKPNFYEEWAQRRIFGVGDKLIFSYGPSNNLMMITKEDYERCAIKKLINSWTSSPTTLELSKPGDYYFIAGSGLHCQLGQKLHVEVVHGSGKLGPVDFDFHFTPVTRELEEGEDNPAAKSAANDVADNAGKAAMDAAGVSEEVASLNKTANDAVNASAQKAGETANKAVNKTADAVTSSSSSFLTLGLGFTLLPGLVAMFL